jgi:hypothetical protein
MMHTFLRLAHDGSLHGILQQLLADAGFLQDIQIEWTNSRIARLMAARSGSTTADLEMSSLCKLTMYAYEKVSS